jgi:hypothetical protein
VPSASRGVGPDGAAGAPRWPKTTGAAQKMIVPAIDRSLIVASPERHTLFQT